MSQDRATPTSQRLTLATGLDAHVLSWGEANRDDHTVVLLHGFLDLAWEWAEVAARLGQRMHVDRAPTLCAADSHHGVGEQADRQHVVEVRMADEDVVDACERVQRQVTDTGAGVDQHVAVEQECRRLAARGDGPGTTEHGKDHLLLMVCGPFPIGSGSARPRGRRSWQP